MNIIGIIISILVLAAEIDVVLTEELELAAISEVIVVVEKEV